MKSPDSSIPGGEPDPLAALAKKLAALPAPKEKEEEGEAYPQLDIGTASRAVPRHLRQLGNYELIRPLGEGGMGAVFEARHKKLGEKRVAVKVLPPFFSLDPRRITRFRAEATTASRVAHPGIVSILDIGEEDGTHFLVQELIEGGRTFAHLIRESREAKELGTGYYRSVAELFAKVADALQATHEAKLVHRDIKPTNILLTPQGEPKVADFGLAKDLEDAGVTGSGESPGTPSFKSPEQVDRRAGKVDARSDIFALGATLYEALTFVRLFDGDSTAEIYVKILRMEATEPRAVRAGVPRDLSVICMKALDKDSNKRFQTMKDLAADLRRHLSNEPILAKPPTRVDRVVKWTKRNPARSVAAGITAVGLVIASGLSAALYAKSEESERRRVAAEQAAVREKEAADLAKTNEHRAVEGEKQAQAERDRADREAVAANNSERQSVAAHDEVFRLSALQRLDDLTAEAERLWPAHPENIDRYGKWLERARALVADLTDHQKKLAELREKARPWTVEELAEFRATHPRSKELAQVERELAFVRERSVVLESGETGPEPTAVEVGVDFATLPADANGLNSLAWLLVDPDRKVFGEERKGLVLARRAVEFAGGSEQATIRHTLAWAFFALARFDEALAEEERAIEEAPADEKTEFEGYLTKLHASIEAELEPEAAQNRISKLEVERSAIEGEVSTRPEWTFDDDKDKWWHNQLERLVDGIRAFADEKTGLFSDGTSEYGWGIKRRLSNAVKLRDGFAPDGEYARAWAAALPKITSVYPGLALRPQLGLVPIGPDPESGLWEFANLETGEPAVRDANAKLVLKEETGLVFVLLRGGTFTMGAQSRDTNGPYYDSQATPPEGPPHEVTLSAFFMSKYEMTQGQWLRFQGRNPSQYGVSEYETHWNRSRRRPDLLHPVECVSWVDCTRVCERLALDLPTEAEWEYGARAGTQTVWWTGGEKRLLAQAGNVADGYARDNGAAAWGNHELDLDDGNTAHAPVGSYQANAFGLHDVIGNLWEWCQDHYQENFYKQGVKNDPVSHLAGSSIRACRSGAFGVVASLSRSACRYGDSPSTADAFHGIRPARNITP